jgi:hypothetical protein
MQDDEQLSELARQCLSGTTGVAEEKTYEIFGTPGACPRCRKTGARGPFSQARRAQRGLTQGARW